MPHKQDPKEVSKEFYEIRDIARKYGAPRELVKKLQAQTITLDGAGAGSTEVVSALPVGEETKGTGSRDGGAGGGSGGGAVRRLCDGVAPKECFVPASMLGLAVWMLGFPWRQAGWRVSIPLI